MSAGDAKLNLTEKNLVWNGNFESSQQHVTLIYEDIILELRNLKVSDSGNITLTVQHPGGNVQLNFELIVLSK